MSWEVEETIKNIEETSSEASYKVQEADPDWLVMLNSMFSSSASESSHPNPQVETGVCKVSSEPTSKSLKGKTGARWTPGGVQKAKNGKALKEIWNEFDPMAAFVSGIQSDARKVTAVEPITTNRKLIGNNHGVYFQYHSYLDKYKVRYKFLELIFLRRPPKNCKKKIWFGSILLYGYF